MQGAVVNSKVLFNSEQLNAGSYIESEPITFAGNQVGGFIAFYLELSSTGNPTIKAEPYISQGSDYVFPTPTPSICTGFTKSSGKGANGKDCFVVDLKMPVSRLKIRITETGGVDGGNVTGILVWQ